MMYRKGLVIQIMFVLIIMEHASSFLHLEEILTGLLECLWSFISRNFYHQNVCSYFEAMWREISKVNFFKTEALFFILSLLPR